MTEQLLPCPFCGGEPAGPSITYADERSGYQLTALTACKCGASMFTVSEKDSLGWRTEDEPEVMARLHTAWNRRAYAAALLALAQMGERPVAWVRMRSECSGPSSREPVDPIPEFRWQTECPPNRSDTTSSQWFPLYALPPAVSKGEGE